MGLTKKYLNLKNNKATVPAKNINKPLKRRKIDQHPKQRHAYTPFAREFYAKTFPSLNPRQIEWLARTATSQHFSQSEHNLATIKELQKMLPYLKTPEEKKTLKDLIRSNADTLSGSALDQIQRRKP